MGIRVECGAGKEEASAVLKSQFFTVFSAAIVLCALIGLMTSGWMLPVAVLFLMAFVGLLFFSGKAERAGFKKFSASALAFMIGTVPGGFAAQAADAWVIDGAKRSAEALMPKIEAHRARTGKYPASIPTGEHVSYHGEDDEFTLTVWRSGMFLDKWSWYSDDGKWVED